MKKLLILLFLFIPFAVGGQIIRASSAYNKVAAGGATTLTDDIYAYFDFEEASGDLIDQVADYDAVVTTATYQGTGIEGYCYDMSGEDVLTWGEDFEFTTAFTINVWITEPNYFSQAEKFMQCYDGAVYQGWYLSLIDDGATNHVRFVVNTSGPDGQIDGATSVYDNGWHMITAIYDLTHLMIYIDGASDATPVDFSTTPTYGTSVCNLSEHVGLADELGFWDRALIESEITELYNSGSGNTYPF